MPIHKELFCTLCCKISQLSLGHDFFLCECWGRTVGSWQLGLGVRMLTFIFLYVATYSYTVYSKITPARWHYLNTWRRHIKGWTLCIAHGETVVARWLAVGDGGGLVAARPIAEKGERNMWIGRNDLDSQCNDSLWRDKWETVKAAERQKSQNRTQIIFGSLSLL